MSMRAYTARDLNNSFLCAVSPGPNVIVTVVASCVSKICYVRGEGHIRQVYKEFVTHERKIIYNNM